MSYHTIFTVITEHSASTVTARYAISLAAACKAGLVLYAAHDEESNEILIRRAARHMDHLYTVATEQGISVTRITETGNICELLPARVLERRADLVFYHLMPGERYGAKLRKHVVHHLLKAISSDLAIMRVVAMVKPHPGTILAPLGNGGDAAGHRLMFVAAVAGCFNARITLLHISKKRGITAMPDGVTRFREQLQQQHLTVLERCGTGNIAEAIGVEAITRHNDLIVMGASERGRLHSFFLGNPAGMVMRQPPCNCILFRPAPESEAS